MRKNWNQHVGDDQLVHGLPKHMEAVAENGDNTYWKIVPGKNACRTCKLMGGMRFDHKPGPVHPNCTCEVRRAAQPVAQREMKSRVVAFDTLQGSGDNETKRFEAGQKISVEIRNLGPFAPGVWLRVDGEVERTTGHMWPGQVLIFEFSKFREPPVPWVVFLMYIGADNSTIKYIIYG